MQLLHSIDIAAVVVCSTWHCEWNFSNAISESL